VVGCAGWHFFLDFLRTAIHCFEFPVFVLFNLIYILIYLLYLKELDKTQLKKNGLYNSN
jgi:hypothetical protein